MKAERTIITLGNFEVEDFRMPDDSCQMSIDRIVIAIQTSQQNVTSFLHSKAVKALLGGGYTPQTLTIESGIKPWQFESGNPHD